MVALKLWKNRTKQKTHKKQQNNGVILDKLEIALCVFEEAEIVRDAICDETFTHMFSARTKEIS